MQCVAARYERKGQQLNTQHAQRRGAGIINTPWPLAVPSCSFIQALPPGVQVDTAGNYRSPIANVQQARLGCSRLQALARIVQLVVQESSIEVLPTLLLRTAPLLRSASVQ